MGQVQDQGRVPTPTEGLLPGQKLVQKLVQTKFTVQELSFSRKHDLSARTLVPGLVEGRSNAPLFSADLHTPQGQGRKKSELSRLPGSEVSLPTSTLFRRRVPRRSHASHAGALPTPIPLPNRRNLFHWRVNSVGKCLVFVLVLW